MKLFCELLNLDNLIIQKADKGNVIVLINKNDYTHDLENLISDPCKFVEVHLKDENDILKYVLTSQDNVLSVLSDMKSQGCISESKYRDLSPVGSKPGILYGCSKVHKKFSGRCPPFRPIISTIGTPAYKIAKFLVPLLSEFISNRFTVKDSFDFIKDIKEENPELYMTTWDIESLFTNIPLDETIEICLDKLYKRRKNIRGISRSHFKMLLEFATKDS